AREMFTNFGYKKVSMNDLALQSKVTKKTIYTYFKDKDTLFEFFIKEQIEKMKDIIESVEERNLTFFDSVHEGLYELLTYRQQQKFLNTISKEANLYPQVSPVIKFQKMIDDSILNYIREKLTKAIEAGDIKSVDVELTTFIIYKIYIAIMLEWDSENHPVEVRKLTDEVSEILKNGFIN
ncbi:MAG TPA: TetR/AcrR family transcriptional regulator, partial [Candidatus Merdenecus merdavium]|nr:TetR/AcrR family transcriptional regulator [Candidatus Merdenecus merdavium]